MLPMINALEVQKGKPAMKKNTTELENPRRRVVRKNKQRELTIGVDLGIRPAATACSTARATCCSSAARRQPRKVWRKLLPAWVPVASQWKWEHTRLG